MGPAQMHRIFHCLMLQDSEDSQPLACQTAIVKRRGRRTSGAVVQRFGDWYNGDDGEVRPV